MRIIRPRRMIGLVNHLLGFPFNGMAHSSDSFQKFVRLVDEHLIRFHGIVPVGL